MTMDLDERGRRAGIELRLLADERAASIRPHGPGTTNMGRRPLVLAGAAAALVGLIVAVGLVMDGSPAVLEIDPVSPTAPDESVQQPSGPIADADGWLPVPPVGEVVAAYRDDLTPVYVTRPDDGEVLVLDPISPHRSSELDKLVAFCPSSGWFEEFYHGSRFNAWGDWTSGPAPSGMAAYPTEFDADSAQVRITGELQPAPARDDPRGDQQRPIGPSCFGDEPADIVAHRPPSSPPALTGGEIPAERWVWATLVLGGEPGDIRVCDPDGTCGSNAPKVTFSSGQPGTQVERAPVTYLARLEADGRIRILHTADPTDGSFLQLDTREQALLSVPEPGTATAITLRDNTPVFATHTDDGDIHLLAAWSPEDPARLLGWCPTDQSLHGPDGRYAPDGRPLDADGGQDLATYGVAVEDIGDTRGIRVTERPELHDDTSTPSAAGDASPSCGTELISHQPTTVDDVFDGPDGIHLSDERWVWVRMPIEARDGELYLCSLADSVPACGVPHPEYTNCLGQERNRPSACPPLQDPVITTPGIEPDDQRRLLLVRANDDATTRIRIPHHTP